MLVVLVTRGLVVVCAGCESGVVFQCAVFHRGRKDAFHQEPPVLYESKEQVYVLKLLKNF